MDLIEKHMPTFVDLARYTKGKNVRCIGWLGKSRWKKPFTVGETTQEFRDALRQLCNHPVRTCLGFHDCVFCGLSSPTQGNGEIFVKNREGQVFAAPTLIYHYVFAHNYRPPDVFIEAVLNPSDSSLRGFGEFGN